MSYDAREFEAVNRTLLENVPALMYDDRLRDQATRAILDAQQSLVRAMPPVDGTSTAFVLATALYWAVLVNRIPIDEEMREASKKVARALFACQAVQVAANIEQQAAADDASGNKPS